MNRPLTAAFAALVLAAPALRAQTTTRPAGTPATSPSSVEAQVRSVLQQLASTDFAQRQKATDAIAKLPPEAYEPLRKAANDPATDEEVRTRLNGALPALAAKASRWLAAKRFGDLSDFLITGRLNAYDTVGEKDPRWDADVRAGIQALAGANGTSAGDGRAVTLLRRALDAGCTDPTVTQAWCALESKLPTANRPAIRAAAERAARRFAADTGSDRAYPACWRLEGYITVMSAISLARTEVFRDDVAIEHWQQEAIAAWPEVVKTPGIPTAHLRNRLNVLLMAKRSDEQSDNRVKDLLLFVMRDIPQAEPLLCGLRGQDALDSAIHAFTHRVAPDRPNEWFPGYLKNARTAYMRLCELDPSDTLGPVGMINVEHLEFDHDRAAMEKWFRMAVDADPNCFDAYEAKYRYLVDRAGMDIAMGFAKECLAQGNWKSGIPKIIVQAHRDIARATTMGDAYFTQPKVWPEIKAAFDGVLKEDPNNYDRSHFMKFAISANQWGTAAQQIAALDNQPDPSAYPTMAEYQRAVALVSSHVPPAATRPKPAASTPAAPATRPAGR
jgi:hypothetical protein